MKYLNLEIENGVAEILLDREDNRNIINLQMYKELKDAITTVEGDKEVRVLVLKGSEPGFCAGADLGNLESLTKESFGKFVNLEYEVFDMLENAPMPTIAVVNGPALGAGFELSLACDFRVADNRALFGFPEPKLGFISPCQRIARIIGETKANELLYTAKNIGGAEAMEMGLLNAFVETDKLEETVHKYISDITKLAPLALRYTKESMLYRRKLTDLSGALQEQKNSLINFTTEDCIEGFSAFKQKRTPIFKGM